MTREEKISLAHSIHQNISSGSFFLIRFSNATVEFLNSFRTFLKKDSISCRFVKISILKKAMNEDIAKELDEVLSGQIAIVYSSSDLLCALRSIRKSNIKLCSAIIDSNIFIGKDLDIFNNISSIQDIYNKIYMSIMSPIHKICYVVRAISAANGTTVNVAAN